jgi:hypothetical protein
MSLGEWVDINRAPILVVAFFVLLIGGWAWWKLQPQRGDVLLIEACRPLYAEARSHEDTVRVDRINPLQRTRGRSENITCGAMRSAGYLD